LEKLSDIPLVKERHKEKLLLKEDLPLSKKNVNTKKELKESEIKKEKKTENLDNELLEIKRISMQLNEENLDKNLFLDLKVISKNLEELMFDIDKKLYYNIELKERIEKIEESIKDLTNLIQELFLTEEKAILYYLKRNKGKPIKLKELYRRFNKKLVNKIVEELYEKGFIKILE